MIYSLSSSFSYTPNIHSNKHKIFQSPGSFGKLKKLNLSPPHTQTTQVCRCTNNEKKQQGCIVRLYKDQNDSLHLEYVGTRSNRSETNNFFHATQIRSIKPIYKKMKKQLEENP